MRSSGRGNGGQLIASSIWGANGTSYTLDQTALADFPASNGTPPDAPIQAGFIPASNLVICEIVIPEIAVATADATGQVEFDVTQTVPGASTVMTLICQGFKSGLKANGDRRVPIQVIAGTRYLWKLQYKIPAGTATFQFATADVDASKNPVQLNIWEA